MSKKLIGLLAGVALFGSGVAFAGDDHHKKQDQQAQQSSTEMTQDSPDTMGSATELPKDESQGVGGAGNEGQGSDVTSGTSAGTTSGQEASTGSSAAHQSELGTGGAGQDQMAAQELTGKVIKAQGQKIFVDHQGAIVELRTNSKTQFEGEVKRAKDLKAGDEIRASFEVKNQTQNLAKSVSKTQATGGSGFEDLGSSTEGGLDNTGSLGGGQGGSGLEEGASEGAGSDSALPGTGGSGTEGSGSESTGIGGEVPDTMGTEPSDDLGTQTGSGAGSQGLDPATESDVAGSDTRVIE